MSDSPGRSRTRRPAAAGQAQIAVLIDSESAAAWRRVARGLARRIREVAAASLSAAGARRPGEITIRLSDDGVVRALNHDFRGKDKPTNVLSFPAAGSPGPVGAPEPLGDIVIAHGVVAREAAAQGKTVEHHLLHLVAHGVLHLLGHDHERPAAAKRMELLETRILAGFGIADPYVIERRRA